MCLALSIPHFRIHDSVRRVEAKVKIFFQFLILGYTGAFNSTPVAKQDFQFLILGYRQSWGMEKEKRVNLSIPHFRIPAGVAMAGEYFEVFQFLILGYLARVILCLRRRLPFNSSF